MRETTLATLNAAAFANAFNEAYSEYLVPFVVDEAWSARYIAGNDLDTARSPLWLADDGAFIGLAALGRRETRGWVGGFGLAVAYRGQGLALGLMAALLREGRAAGLAELWLEVLTENTRAIRAYERAGFAHVREVRIFAQQAEAATTLSGELLEANPADLLRHAARLRPVRPTWQRESASIAHGTTLAGLALGSAAHPDAYVIYGASQGNASILDFAAPTLDLALTLAAALPAALPGSTLRLTNEPTESPVCAALDQLGWQETLRQYEMCCPL